VWHCVCVNRVGDAAMEQALVYEKLPRDIADRHVLLLDPMLGCGSSAVKAIEVQQGHALAKAPGLHPSAGNLVRETP
jgi:uracil phosphoribosyltransferase